MNTKGTFKKGMTPWNKGKKGVQVYSKERNKKISLWAKGRKMSPEAVEKNRQARLKNPNRYWLGKKRLEMVGDKHWNWKGGITPEIRKLRNSPEYKLWKVAVFTRDNRTCVWCGYQGRDINADHIKPFAYFPELRFAIDNGRTLCVPCHKTTETYLNRWTKQ